ncbi:MULTISPECIES: ABC transporter permease [Paraclostridium]|jgi:putative aldouronate transport system permease protein|uniref:Binding--dependent transport system inner membrane component family protein n=1 Tax=Paraclostridium bifermentans ATCC 638 = DSM 14991 TaxID=1233171 RepID=T4VDV5_PARBF|nr:MULTISPECIES: sugar ABC transporter permease [Paraclostridium]KGJ50838.1 sugar ABC transporter permease [Clostridium sp. NCR]MDV8110274.1 sugar ABC transporter permease [Bacillus sp. BAU-SS-2023]RDC50518.1 sugar ABC transporter permease [Acinetobacter sp. RIT592]EQK41919.1 binding--dependent transport system inner membrane component family protein [[Clostridium] bifermentans ATCC 638] [Paraclostridium bifermentans ATCC 638 = DSM 14991]MBS5953388.1 sugar ABC transporter permease [Paraclostri
MKKFMKDLWKNRAWLLMVLPGTIWLLVFSYLPMFGTVLAFKNYKMHPGGFVQSLINSEWVGFDNFKFLFTSGDAFRITRNTILYNLVFIVLGLIFAVFVAITLSEIANKKLAKVYQTGMLFPHFLSWVIVSYFVFSFLSTDKGMVNSILSTFGAEPVAWYSEPKHWPFILIFMNIWKGVGYGSIVYLAAIVGIDRTYYEAATIDGASKWQQIKNITIPLIVPLMIILTIMAIGRIFNSDFGLFYNIPRNSAVLYPVTDVIDTYIYKGLMNMGNIGMSTAAGLYQAAVGFILIMTTNKLVKKVDPEYGLF